jgi:hypothetical protein
MIRWDPALLPLDCGAADGDGDGTDDPDRPDSPDDPRDEWRAHTELLAAGGL